MILIQLESSILRIPKTIEMIQVKEKVFKYMRIVKENMGTLLVTGTLVNSVALGTLGLENLLPGFCISRRSLLERRHVC